MTLLMICWFFTIFFSILYYLNRPKTILQKSYTDLEKAYAHLESESKKSYADLEISFINFKKDIEKQSLKKHINKLFIDPTGECYCPQCKTLLDLKPYAKSTKVRTQEFYCSSCHQYRFAWLPEGHAVVGVFFHRFQKSNPQVEMTRKAAIKLTRKIEKENITQPS